MEASKLNKERHEYTLTELYGMYTPMPEFGKYQWEQPRECLECGCLVVSPDIHLDFHNDVENK